MSLPRAAALSAISAALIRKAGAFSLRFLRDEPLNDHERKIFLHLNGLIEAVVNRVLNRTFSPTPLRAVQ
jgi:hypothetical protein